MIIKPVYKSVISFLLILLFVFSASIPAFTAEYGTEGSTESESMQAKDADDGGIAVTGAQEEVAETGTVATPQFSSIEGSGRQVVFKWQAVTGASKYQLFYYSTTEAKYKKLALTADTTYTWSGATVGVSYKYTIRCCDANGSFISGYLKEGMTFKLMLDTPKISGITKNNSGGINITWDEVEGAVKYRVFYKTETSWKWINDTTSTTFNHTRISKYGDRVVYTVRCVSADGTTWESAYDSTGVGFTYGIATPKIKSVVKNTTKNSLDITWDEIIDAYMYVIFIKNSNDGDWTRIGQYAANENNISETYSWVNYTPGVSYTFTIRCVDEYDNFCSDYDSTGYSYTVNIDTPKVTSVEKATNSSVTIKWDAVSGAYKYRVFYKNGTSWKRIDDTSGTSYTWTSPIVGQSYTYTVRCVNEAGKFSSGYDSTGYSYTLYLDTPEISSITSSGSTAVKISWGAVTGAAKYRIFYKNGTSWKTIATTTSTSYTWTKPGFGVAYTYTVRCLSSDGKLWTSDYNRTGYSHTLYLDTPKITSCSVLAENKFSIKWDKVEGASKYRIFYYVYSKKHYVKIGDTANTTFNVTNAKLNSTYKLTVRCISSDASKWESDYDADGYTFKFELATPKITAAESQGGSDVKITWGAVTGAVKYAVFMKNDPWKIIGYSTTNSFTWTSAVVNTSYVFTVRCIYDGEWVSSYDSTGFSYKHQLKTPVIKLVTSLDETTVKLTWDAVTGAYAYRVFYKNGSSWKGIATTTATKYIWDECTKNKSYIYTVRCVDKDGNFTSSFDPSGYTYTITNLTSSIADVALAEVEYWNEGMHGYSSQGYKYTDDLGVNFNEWCGYFATYCCKHAGIAMFQNNKTIYGFVGAWETWGINNNQWYPKGSGYVPSPGDMAIWGSGNDHVTVVVKVDEEAGVFYDVGGNEVSYSRYSSVVNYDGPFYYDDDSYLKGIVGTHILED